MGKPGAFLDIDRVTHELRPVEERSHDFDPLYVELDDDARRAQASRCMMCGVAFCQMGASFGKARPSGCPLHNLIPEWNDEGTITNEERILITQSMKEVNQIMESYVGIVRSNVRLTRAWNRLDILYEETESLFKRSKASREICELRNMINVGYLITRQAMERKESRGLHYTIDYPREN